MLASTPQFAEVGLAQVRVYSLSPQKALKKEQKKHGVKEKSSIHFKVWHTTSVFRLVQQVFSDLQNRKLYHLFL